METNKQQRPNAVYQGLYKHRGWRGRGGVVLASFENQLKCSTKFIKILFHK